MVWVRWVLWEMGWRFIEEEDGKASVYGRRSWLSQSAVLALRNLHWFAWKMLYTTQSVSALSYQAFGTHIHMGNRHHIPWTSFIGAFPNFWWLNFVPFRLSEACGCLSVISMWLHLWDSVFHREEELREERTHCPASPLSTSLHLMKQMRDVVSYVNVGTRNLMKWL